MAEGKGGGEMLDTSSFGSTPKPSLYEYSNGGVDHVPDAMGPGEERASPSIGAEASEDAMHRLGTNGGSVEAHTHPERHGKGMEMEHSEHPMPKEKDMRAMHANMSAAEKKAMPKGHGR